LRLGLGALSRTLVTPTRALRCKEIQTSSPPLDVRPSFARTRINPHVFSLHHHPGKRHATFTRWFRTPLGPNTDSTVVLKFTSRKTVLLKNVKHVPSIKKNLFSGSLMCCDGFKIVLESNKCAVSRHGTFVGKSYDCGGLFRLSLLDDVCNKLVNTINISNESNLWHSRLCHVNFGCLMRLANMNLIPKFNLVKGSKCHMCMQSKQSCKPHKGC
jgi:hypothetical protein